MAKSSSVAPPSGTAEKASMKQIELQGQVRLRASVSMLFTDILSQELSSAISAPDSVELIQKHLQNRQLTQLTQRELQPLLENIPENIFDIAKEAAFSSGALVKRIPCLIPLETGDSFAFRGSGLMAEIELKDGRVQAIRPLKKA